MLYILCYMLYLRVDILLACGLHINLEGVTSGAGPVNPSGRPEFTPGF